MCYDVKATLKSQLNRARIKGDEQAIQEILEQLIPLTDLPIYHSNGFNHPTLLIYPHDSPDYPIVAKWGLIPAWTKDEIQKNNIWNHTLNARAETMFEKPAFRESAHSKRCIIYLDGFFEHHHLGKQTYPFYICRKDDYPMAVAGLWSEWLHPLTGEKINTFTIVTTTGNSLMTKIHNHPKQHGPRMPFLLTDELTEFWLSKEINGNSQKQLLEHLQSPASIELKAITVNALRGKRYKGNVPQVTEEVTYPELGFFDFTP